MFLSQINRFCRSLDCGGFPDFKLRVAQSLAHGTPYASSNVDPNDSVAEFSSKIFDMTISSIEDAKNNLDTESVDKAIMALAQAKKLNLRTRGISFSRHRCPTQVF